MKLAFKVFFILFNTVTFANISLPAVFCDNMVLQQNSNVAFWGTASPNEAISIFVSWSKMTYKINATESGNWKLDIRKRRRKSTFHFQVSNFQFLFSTSGFYFVPARAFSAVRCTAWSISEFFPFVFLITSPRSASPSGVFPE